MSGVSQAVSGKYRVIPLIEEHAAEHLSPRRADPETQQALGSPGERVDDWQQRAIDRLGELVSGNRGLKVFLDSCTRCGACTDKCHYFLGTHDPKNMPVARQELLRSVYKRYFTFAGRHFPWLTGARDLDEQVLDDWYRYYHQCSECRRCTVYCPQGIDTTEVTMAGRDILAHIGIGAHYTRDIIGKAERIGNNLGMNARALADTLASLEEDLLEETGLPIRLPLNEIGAEVLLVTPSADFFAEPHVDGLLGYAKVLHAAGVRWTLSTHASEAANFALFEGSAGHMRKIAGRMVDALCELEAQELVIGECGHAWRVAYSLLDTLLDQPAEARGRMIKVRHICELTHSLWRSGRIVLDAERNADKVVTYHDSCNVARGAGMGALPGGQFTVPRELLAASCPRVVEMAADTTRQRTFCCGGGGGLLTDDLLELRIKGSKPRAEALQRVVSSHGVTHLAAICAICKTQLSDVLPAHDLASVEVVSLHQLVGDALRLPEVDQVSVVST